MIQSIAESLFEKRKAFHVMPLEDGKFNCRKPRLVSSSDNGAALYALEWQMMYHKCLIRPFSTKILQPI